MRIDLNPLAPVAAVPSNAITPVTEITGRMALAMAAAELANNAGHTGSQQSDAQAQQRSLVPNPVPSRSVVSAATMTAAAANAPELAARALAVPDRLTLSNTAAMLNPVSAPRTAALPSAAPQPSVFSSALPLAKPSLFELPQSVPASLPSATPRTAAAVAGPSADVASLAAKPPAQFLIKVLEGLTGEPADQLHLLDLRPPMESINTTYGPQLAAAKTGASLNLLLQGTVRTSDGQQLPFGLTAAVARGLVDAALAPALTALLSRQHLVLDYPGLASDLAEQTVHFQMALDPRNLWPLQSFLFSGLLTMGKPKPAAHGEEEWEWVWEEEESPDDGLPLPKKRRQKTQATQERSRQ